MPVRPWRRKTTPWSTIIGHEYKGSGTDSDPYIVTWLPGDVENPFNYSSTYKWTCTLIGECLPLNDTALM